MSNSDTAAVIDWLLGGGGPDDHPMIPKRCAPSPARAPMHDALKWCLLVAECTGQVPIPSDAYTKTAFYFMALDRYGGVAWIMHQSGPIVHGGVRMLRSVPLDTDHSVFIHTHKKGATR
jgi:hypothetical protein